MRVLIPERLTPSAVAPPQGDHILLSGAAMGTSWSVRAFAPSDQSPDALRSGIETVLADVIAQMSSWEAGSDISRFNQAPAGSRHALPSGFATVLAAALDIATRSGGGFDPTAGALVDLWGFGPIPASQRPPPAAAIATALGMSGWRKLGWEPASRVAIQPGGLVLDLSGIAKGHAVDRVFDWLLSRGVTSCLVEIGGELRGTGIKPDGQPWWVMLESPPDAGGACLDPTRIALHGLAVATSGDYNRFFEAGGRRYAHSIDPRSGWPIANDLASVSVVHDSCMWADGWATALTVLGMEAGVALADELALAALFVRRHDGGLEERPSAAFAAMADDS